MIKSAAQSSITSSKKFTSLAAGYVASSDFKLTETVVGTAIASVTFDVSSYAAQGYKNLQIRVIGRSTNASTQTVLAMQYNSITTTTYSVHRVTANGSTVTAGGNANNDWVYAGIIPAASAVSGNFGPSIIDIPEFSSANKNKTSRCWSGNTAGNELDFYSGCWYSTSAITSIKLYPYAGNFEIGTCLALYGSV